MTTPVNGPFPPPPEDSSQIEAYVASLTDAHRAAILMAIFTGEVTHTDEDPGVLVYVLAAVSGWSMDRAGKAIADMANHMVEWSLSQSSSSSEPDVDVSRN